MPLKENKLLKKFAATLKKFSAQGAKKVEYGMLDTAKFFRKKYKHTRSCIPEDLINCQ